MGTDFTRFVVYEACRGAATPIEITPRLESWDKAGSRSQVELTRYLDHVVSIVGPLPADEPSLGLDLTIGLDEGVSRISGGRDLDNYLYPVIRRFGWGRFVSASASKGYAPSAIRIGPVALLLRDAMRDWACAMVETRSSSAHSNWKGEIRDQLVGQVGEIAPAGPVELQLCFRVSRRRNWAYLWKPAIDALGTILGQPDGARPFHPDDDRVVRLGLHRVIDDAIGNRVQIGIWWRSTT